MSYNLPYGMAADSSGIFYVADYGDSVVYTADPNTLAVTGTFIGYLTITGIRPTGIIIDVSSNMYISDKLSGTVYKVPISNPAGYTTFASGIPQAYSMAIDYLTNTMYVSSASTGNIFSVNYPAGGVASSNWVAGYTGVSQIVMDGSRNLFVADETGVFVINIPTHIGATTGTQIVTQSNTGNYTGITLLYNYIYITSSAGVGVGNIINVYNYPSGSAVSLSWKTNLLGADYLYAYNGYIYVSDDTELHRYNPYGICFLKGTMILCERGYQLIEDIKPGTLVKTLKHGYVPAETINSSTIYNSDNDERISERLYLLSKSIYHELSDNLVVTGGHSVLVDYITPQQQERIKLDLKCNFVTEGKYRLPAYIDERSIIYPLKGTFDIYHICLENENEQANYGIYANGGLLVESCCKRHI